MKVTVFFDGGCRRAAGIAAGAAVVYDGEDEIAYETKFLTAQTVNQAEYAGLHVGLELARKVGATEVMIYGDSEVVVRQVDGRYQARKPHLRVLRNRVWELGAYFDKVEIRETPRAVKAGSRSKEMRRRNNNARADELCTRTMDQRTNLYYDQIEKEVM